MNNEGLVDIAKLRKNKAKANFRGKSAYRFIHGNKIIKIYASDKDNGYAPIDRDSIIDLSTYKSDTIVFPDSYLYEKKEKVGEIMNYIKADHVRVPFYNNINVNRLLVNYENAYNDITVYNNILMRDLCDVNILYSEKDGFHIIDTTEWEFSDKNTVPYNIYKFKSSLVNIILEYIDMPIIYRYDYPMIDGIIQENALKYGSVGQRYFKVLNDIVNNKCSFQELLFAYMSLYQKMYNRDLKTMNDVKEMTKILKKG